MLQLRNKITVAMKTNLGTAFVIHETVFFACEVTLEILPPRDGSLLEFPLDHLSGRTKYTGLLDEQHLRLSRYRASRALHPLLLREPSMETSASTTSSRSS